MNTYQKAKAQLKNATDLVKKNYPNDKPMIRQWINDTCDAIIKDTLNCPSFKVSDVKRDQYINWLCLYACKLHP